MACARTRVTGGRCASGAASGRSSDVTAVRLAGSVAYSPDGKVLLVGGTYGHVTAFDAATRKPLWDYKDESGHFAAVAYSSHQPVVT